MKTIVRNSDKISLYIFDDDEVINVKEDCIEVGEPIRFVICDMNETNCTVINGVSAQPDWFGHKYLYDDGWKPNPDYVELEPEASEAPAE